jgi:hypothetical protein
MLNYGIMNQQNEYDISKQTCSFMYTSILHKKSRFELLIDWCKFAKISRVEILWFLDRLAWQNHTLNRSFTAIHSTDIWVPRLMNSSAKVTLSLPILSRKPEVKRLHGRSSYRWKNMSKVDFKHKGYESVDWIILVQDRMKWCALIKTEINLRLSSNCCKFQERVDNWSLLMTHTKLIIPFWKFRLLKCFKRWSESLKHYFRR